MSKAKPATKKQHKTIRDLAIDTGADEVIRVIKRFGITSSVALTFNQAIQTIALLTQSLGIKAPASTEKEPPTLISEKAPQIGSITDKQKSYLKSLIRKAGDEAYHEIMLDEGIVAVTEVNHLSLKQASRMIGHLIAQLEKSNGGLSVSYQVTGGFLIESDSGVTFECASPDRLITWAEKRFQRDRPSLEKVMRFTTSNEQEVTVTGYIIKRSL